MGVHRGANLVGMSLLLLDVCPFSWVTGRKKKYNIAHSIFSYLSKYIMSSTSVTKIYSGLLKLILSDNIYIALISLMYIIYVST